jgi:hypothetical protein
MDHPTEIKEGMVFAIETYCPATDGFSAARIEEEVVVTDKGCRLISLFPAEELPISAKYWTEKPERVTRSGSSTEHNQTDAFSLRCGKRSLTSDPG